MKCLRVWFLGTRLGKAGLNTKQNRHPWFQICTYYFEAVGKLMETKNCPTHRDTNRPSRGSISLLVHFEGMPCGTNHEELYDRVQFRQGNCRSLANLWKRSELFRCKWALACPNQIGQFTYSYRLASLLINTLRCVDIRLLTAASQLPRWSQLHYQNCHFPARYVFVRVRVI